MDLAAGPAAQAGGGAGRYGAGAREQHTYRPLDVPGLTTEETPLKADPFVQLKLLDVQELDSRLDALAHQRRSLTEIARLAAETVRRKELDDQVRDLRIAVDDLTADQKRADRDVEQVKGRRERDRSRMEQGLVTNPKDLERMGHELESLERRISSLEDDELEVMEKLEEAQQGLGRVGVELEAADRMLAELTHDRDHKFAAIDEEISSTRRERITAADTMPADLMTLYQKLREAKGGVGAAALRRGECGGCRLGLNAADLRAIAAAPTDEVLRCEECQRILVRTGESGL